MSTAAINAYIADLQARIKELEEQNNSLQFSLQCEATDKQELLEILRSVYNCSGQRNYLTQPVLDEVLRAITK